MAFLLLSLSAFARRSAFENIFVLGNAILGVEVDVDGEWDEILVATEPADANVLFIALMADALAAEALEEALIDGLANAGEVILEFDAAGVDKDEQVWSLGKRC